MFTVLSSKAKIDASVGFIETSGATGMMFIYVCIPFPIPTTYIEYPIRSPLPFLFAMPHARQHSE